MSLSSPLLESAISTKVYTKFQVDFFTDGGDMVYHFYPMPVDKPFPGDFHLSLENAFQAILPDGADVRAEFIENYELRMIERSTRPDEDPCSSFWVRVMKLANNPMSSKFLKSKIFDILEESTRN